MSSRTRAGVPLLSTGRKLLFTALVVVSICATIEGIARLVWAQLERNSLRAHYQRGEKVLSNDAVNYMKVPDGVYGYMMKPGFRNGNDTINSQGFRQADDVPLQRSNGSLRIVCLGESTTLGTGDQSNYPSLLRQILDHEASGFRSYEVINAGVPGWLSDQIALRVHHQIVAFNPDVAILYVGWNDFQTYDPLRPVASESSFTAGFDAEPFLQYADNASRTVALLRAWAGRRAVQGHTAEEYRDAAAHATPPDLRYRFLLKNLTDIVDEFRSTNPSIKIFVSTLVGMWPQTAAEGKMVVPFWVNEHHVTPVQAAHFVDELNEQVRRFASAHNVGLIDAAAVFGPLDRQRLQWDFAHMYKDGYELLAWTMFEGLRSSGTVSARSVRRYQELQSAYRRSPEGGAESGASR